MRIDDFPYEDGSSLNIESDEFSDRYRRRLGKSGKKSTQKKKKKKEKRVLKDKKRKKKVENVMQSGKLCRSPFVRGHASY